MNYLRPHAALRLSDRDLLAECEVHTYRASGPGGQKRNKVESAVRICHVPSGVSAIAEESRSQLENRPHALRRLREAIAIRLRSPVEFDDFELPGELRAVLSPDGRIRLTDKNPNYPIVVATVLDVLAACAGRVSDAAKYLEISTHHLTQFLSEHPHVWQEANRIRQGHGQRPLRVS
jgi:hypothetical protein